MFINQVNYLLHIHVYINTLYGLYSEIIYIEIITFKILNLLEKIIFFGKIVNGLCICVHVQA